MCVFFKHRVKTKYINIEERDVCVFKYVYLHTCFFSVNLSLLVECFYNSYNKYA